MKTLSWNDNWFIDVDDIDENNVTISGNSDTPNNVWVKFKAGVTPREYIITYNDGIRCITKTYTVAGAPCSCTVTSYYTSSSAHTASAENEKFTVGTITETNCSCDDFYIARIEGDDLLHLEDSDAGLGVDKETGIIWALSGVSENTSSETRHVKYSISCDTCNGELVFYQKGTAVTCGCNAITVNGTYEPDPTSDDGKIKISIDSISGDWTPSLELHTSNNTKLISVDGYGASTVVVKDWLSVGTCSKIKFVQVRENYTKITATIQRGDNLVTLLSNATIPSSGEYLNLSSNFNVSDYYNSSNCILKFTFR